MSKYELEHQTKLLDAYGRQYNDRVEGYTRPDILGVARKGPTNQIAAALATAREDARLNPDIPVWPIMLGKQRPDEALLTTGFTGDLTVNSSELFTWASAIDHTQTFGKSKNGFWQWGVNLFPLYAFGQISAIPLADQSGTVEFDYQLLDATGAILTQASVVASFSITIATPTYTQQLISYTIGTEQITEFNAFYFQCLVSNTDLSATWDTPIADINYTPNHTSIRSSRLG